ncbi:MAG TPA: hypothetical protein VF192_11605 [Longimicrobiales bacterium]
MSEHPTGARVVRQRGRRAWPRLLCMAVTGALYIVLANDGRHHWHEWRHVYSAAHFTIEQLAAGEFDPGPPPERTATEAAGWYWGQLGHEALLRAIIRLAGPGLGTVALLEWLYGLLVPLAALLTFLTLRRLPLGTDPSLISAATLLSPLAVYLGFKLMGEVPALLFAAFAGYLFLAGLRARHRLAAAALQTGAGLSLALCFLCKVFMPLSFFGFALALPAAFPEYGWRRVSGRLLLTTGVAAAAAAWAGAAVSVRPADWALVYVFFRDYRQPAAASAFGLLSAGSLLYALVPFSFLARDSRAVRFFAAWLGFTAAPVLLLATNFVEARYLAVALVPFAGLGVAGLEEIVRRVRGPVGDAALRTRSAIATLVIVPVATAGALPFLPYEMSCRELVNLVTRIWGEDPDAALLVPWNYTDYHLLAFAFPGRPIYLVQSPVDDRGVVYRDSLWERRQERNYGPAFIPGPEDLGRVAETTRVYLGHGVLPPIANLRKLASSLGITPIVRSLDALQPRRHITESWLWSSPEVRLQEALRVGRYAAYRVEATPAAPP